MVISRLEIELAHHGGNDNGRLPVTTDDFVEHGMHRSSVSPAIRESEALGFVRVTERGRGGNAEYRMPNMFFLTFAHSRDSGKNPPTHDWRRIKSMREAEEIARNARADKNPYAVQHGIRSWRKRQQKRNAGTEERHTSVREKRTERVGDPVRKTRTTGSGGKTVLLSIARVGDRRDATSSRRASPSQETSQSEADCVARSKHVGRRGDI